MNDGEEAKMKEYGITKKTKTVYQYEGHSYAKLQDAVNYAQIQQTLNDKELNAEKNDH